MKKLPIPSFPMPSASELAQLAALLAPGEPPDAAMKVAMAFYVEAVLFSRELSKSEDKLVFEFGTDSRKLERLSQPCRKIWADTLTLGPESSADDPVRQFLRNRGLMLKQPKSVIGLIKRYWATQQEVWESEFEMSVEEFLSVCKREQAGKPRTYAIPRHLLESLPPFSKERRRQTRLKAARTRQRNNGG